MSWSVLLSIVSIYAPMNLFVIILTWWPPRTQPSIPSFVTPGVASSIIVFGFFYWIVFAKVLPALGYHIDSEPDELVDGSRVVMYKVCSRKGGGGFLSLYLYLVVFGKGTNGLTVGAGGIAV